MLTPFSESFKLLSVYSVPLTTPSIYVSVPLFHRGDPLLFVPDGSVIRMFNITRLNHRDIPPFPFDTYTDEEEGEEEDDDDELQNMTSAMRLGSYSEEERMYDNDDSDAPLVYRREKPEKKLFEQVQGWVADTKRRGAPRLPAELPDIEKCQLAFGGRVILAIGKEGSLYSWKLA